MLHLNKLVSNHDTSCLLSYNSQLTLYKNSNFVNNSGTFGGGMALYDSSHLILKEQTNISFVNNYASESGGGIFVSETIIARDFPTYFFFLNLKMIIALLQHYIFLIIKPKYQVMSYMVVMWIIV